MADCELHGSSGEEGKKVSSAWGCCCGQGACGCEVAAFAGAAAVAASGAGCCELDLEGLGAAQSAQCAGAEGWWAWAGAAGWRMQEPLDSPLRWERGHPRDEGHAAELLTGGKHRPEGGCQLSPGEVRGSAVESGFWGPALVCGFGSWDPSLPAYPPLGSQVKRGLGRSSNTQQKHLRICTRSEKRRYYRI